MLLVRAGLIAAALVGAACSNPSAVSPPPTAPPSLIVGTAESFVLQASDLQGYVLFGGTAAEATELGKTITGRPEDGNVLAKNGMVSAYVRRFAYRAASMDGTKDVSSLVMLFDSVAGAHDSLALFADRIREITTMQEISLGGWFADESIGFQYDWEARSPIVAPYTQTTILARHLNAIVWLTANYGSGTLDVSYHIDIAKKQLDALRTTVKAIPRL